MNASVGTDPHMIRRNDGPDTSEAAAHSVDTRRFEQLALQIHIEHGTLGCTMDQLRAAFKERAPENTQFVNRRTGLHQKGLILVTGTKRRGEAGREQYVYVARECLSQEWVDWIKANFGWLNPCLFGEGEEIPDDPDSERALIRALANDLASQIHGMMQEGGVISSSVGQPLDHEDSPLGRACAYLGKPIPLCPDFHESLSQL